MSWFSKAVKTVSHAAKKTASDVSHTATSAANTVSHTVTNTANDAANTVVHTANDVAKVASNTAKEAAKVAEQAAKEAEKTANTTIKKAAAAAEIAKVWSEIEALKAENTALNISKQTALTGLSIAKGQLSAVNSVTQLTLNGLQQWINLTSKVPVQIKSAHIDTHLSAMQGAEFNLKLKLLIAGQSKTLSLHIDFKDLVKFEKVAQKAIEKELQNIADFAVNIGEGIGKDVNTLISSAEKTAQQTVQPVAIVKDTKSINAAQHALAQYQQAQLAFNSPVNLYNLQHKGYLSARGKDDHSQVGSMSKAGPWEKFVLVNPNNIHDTSPIKFGDPIAICSQAWHNYISARGDKNGDSAQMMNAQKGWELFTLVNKDEPNTKRDVLLNEPVSFLSSQWHNYLSNRGNNQSITLMKEIGTFEEWLIKKAK
ncbi:hypothetical protein [Flocculibacter collagenilyticus]|uniref:hypothetical protein n=1 Tax=Flocculibacter collagenilyticus TaxID=2744479 RepID=UPI0018F583E2|nr:hypothetical protein [Flocculibacter collagenilyticus]